jgi:predicted MFS family arabinose efflux permease
VADLSLVVACAAQFLSAVNLGVGPLILPRLAVDMDLGGAGQSWVVSGYALAFGGLVLLGGRLADVYGASTMLVIGYSVAVVAAGLAWLAPSVIVLVAARIGQGAAAAATVPAALSIIVALKPDHGERARALALWAGSGAIGFGIGLAIGGLASDTVGWRALFLAVGAVSLVLVIASRLILPPTARPGGTVSVTGGLLSSAGLFGLAYAVTIGFQHGVDPLSIAIAVLSVGAIWLFVRLQARSAAPLMPLSIWRTPGFAATATSAALLYGGWAASYYFAAQILHDAMLLSSTKTSMAMLPLAFGATVGSRLAGRVLPHVRHGRVVIISGSLMCALATAVLSAPAAEHVAAIVPALLCVVAGQSFAFVAQNLLTMSAAGAGEAGLAGAIFNAGCQVASGLVISVLASVAQAATRAGHSPAAGYHLALVGSAVFSALAALVMLPPRRDS